MGGRPIAALRRPGPARANFRIQGLALTSVKVSRGRTSEAPGWNCYHHMRRVESPYVTCRISICENQTSICPPYPLHFLNFLLLLPPSRSPKLPHLLYSTRTSSQEQQVVARPAPVVIASLPLVFPKRTAIVCITN
jgi:hypothetical protein